MCFKKTKDAVHDRDADGIRIVEAFMGGIFEKGKFTTQGVSHEMTLSLDANETVATRGNHEDGYHDLSGRGQDTR